VAPLFFCAGDHFRHGPLPAIITGMASLTAEFPRMIPRAVWLTARARNAVRRPVFIGAVGIGTLAAVLIAMLFAPQQIKHFNEPRLADLGARPDTTSFVNALAQSRVRLTSAESSLAQARVRITTIPKQNPDTLNPQLIARRDSLSMAVNDLDGLLTRVETAPVTASYRALAESPQLVPIPRVKVLADSIVEIDRERDTFGATGTGDPAYVALTTRFAETGHEIQALAQQRRDVLRQEIARVVAPTQQQEIAETPAVDTAGWVAERDTAQSLVSQATTALTGVRGKADEYDRAAKRARDQANFNASPVALLGAALVLGVVLGFGAAFVDEMRHPRISGDEHEVERVTGTRVLATTAPRPRQPDRSRRAADKAAPRYFDPGADGYQLTYLHVARTGASRVMLTIASEDTGIAAVVAMNVAAIAADEARSTIIVDTDAQTSPVAAALRTHAEPGLADVLQRRVDWSEATSQAPAGRDRYVDIVPSGVSNEKLDTAQVTELLRQEAPRLLRHYEAVIVVTSLDAAANGLPGALPIPDTVICARVGRTRIADINRAIDKIRQTGGKPLGIVLWDSIPPSLPSPDRIARSPRPVRTAEMRAMTGAR
jgi:Mrp family chromosome partitioning ATPase